MSKVQVVCNQPLDQNQQAMANKIAQYGVDNGYSTAEIAIAVKTAFIESSLGDDESTPAPTTDNPNPTARGGQWGRS
jgi:hypothetical protein